MTKNEKIEILKSLCNGVPSNPNINITQIPWIIINTYKAIIKNID